MTAAAAKPPNAADTLVGARGTWGVTGLTVTGTRAMYKPPPATAVMTATPRPVPVTSPEPWTVATDVSDDENDTIVMAPGSQVSEAVI